MSWDKQKPVGAVGKEYVLRIVNLRSSVQTGNIYKLQQVPEATSFFQVLLKIYLMFMSIRSLQKFRSGLGKITFANLPNKAKIVILNLQGKQVATIEENNGDGGVDFSLKDQNGDALSSGIYLYRIIQLDNTGNEVEEKIGKFVQFK